MAEQNRGILVNGVPGTEMDAAIGKLPNGRNAHEIEHRMRTLFLDEPENRLHPFRPLIAGPDGLKHLLMLPKPYLDDLWRRAADAALADTRRSGEAIYYVLAHMVYYLTDYRDFFSCVSLRGLQPFGFSCVVTLIDDIYDLFYRLSRQDRLFYSSERDPLVRSIDANEKHLRLLSWRSHEISLAERVAFHLQIPHYVVAVKHPVQAVSDLLFSGKTPVYVSHPISQVRRLARYGFEAEASLLREQVHRLCRALIGSGEVVPLMPTTIDEYRIREVTPGRYVPELIERWEFDRLGEVLYERPAESYNPLFPVGEFAALPVEAKEAICHLTGLLARGVESQITSRDRKLAEQSAALVAYRPYFSGNRSSGMMTEIAHGTAVMAQLRLPERSLVSFSTLQERDHYFLMEGLWRAIEMNEEQRVRLSVRLDRTGVVSEFSRSRLSAEDLENVVTREIGDIRLRASSGRSRLSGEKVVVDQTRRRAALGEVIRTKPRDDLDDMIERRSFHTDPLEPEQFADRAVHEIRGEAT